jgi:hypothetical protein
MASPAATPQIGEPSLENLTTIGEELVRLLPEAPDLESLHIWPWFPWWDCKPDIVFVVTQDCGDGLQTIYSESNWQARWDIGTLLTGITLVANDKACCAPCICVDPRVDDCLVMQGICGVPSTTSSKTPPAHSWDINTPVLMTVPLGVRYR